MPKIRLMLCLICASMLFGCANYPKILESSLTQLDKKSLVLATVTLHQNNKDLTDLLLPFYFVIGKTGNKDYKTYRFPYPDFSVSTKTENNTPLQLIILNKESGDYTFAAINGEILNFSSSGPSNSFQQANQLNALSKGIATVNLPVANSNFFKVPMLMNFNVEKNEISYIGNIHIIIKDSTVEIEINDKYESDMKTFETIFPNLQGRNIVKRILPQWKQPSP